MNAANNSETSVDLLGRLRIKPYDEAAWGEFFRRYEPKIFEWCKSWKLHEDEARDVTQAVLLKLVQRMTTFAYDGDRSFRAYLKTLTHYALCDALEARKRPGLGIGGSEVVQALESIEAKDDLTRRLQDQFDHELMDEAMRRVSLRIEPKTLRAFQMLTFEGLTGIDVANQLDMKVATVFVCKSKVMKLLREEIARLEQL